MIGLDEPIAWYDRPMTQQRAAELQPAVAAAFEPFCETNAFDAMMVLASGDYMFAMAKCWALLKEDVRVVVPTGSIGGRVSQLREWLYGQPPAAAMTGQVNATVRFKGKDVGATASEVFAIARRELPQDRKNAFRFETWCVPVDDRFVAPKWLVSRLSGVPVSAFRTADAISLLRKLGVEVKRVPPQTHERSIAKDAL